MIPQSIDLLLERCKRPACTVMPREGQVILCHETQEMLERYSGGHQQIIEIGSWLGFSALRLMKLNPGATILCIDPWLGSSELVEMHLRPEIDGSYQQFLANTYHARQWIWPLRMTGVDGLALAHKCDFHPSLIFIDGSHEYEAVWGDIHTARRLFPEATLVLDDLNHPGVRQAAAELLGVLTDVDRNAAAFVP